MRWPRSCGWPTASRRGTRLLERFPVVARQFAGARPIAPLRLDAAAVSYRAAVAAGPRWAMLPSAAAFVDPLFSTGFPLTLLGIERLAPLLERAPFFDDVARGSRPSACSRPTAPPRWPKPTTPRASWPAATPASRASTTSRVLDVLFRRGQLRGDGAPRRARARGRRFPARGRFGVRLGAVLAVASGVEARARRTRGRRAPRRGGREHRWIVRRRRRGTGTVPTRQTPSPARPNSGSRRRRWPPLWRLWAPEAHASTSASRRPCPRRRRWPRR